MTSLTWDQVRAWRLARHHLLDRAPRGAMLEVVSAINGLHAQLMSSAELSVWARVEDASPADVQTALWRDRHLVKTWAMRGTLHLIPTRDYPLFVAALSRFDHFRRGSWLKYYGLTMEGLEALLESVQQTLTDRGITREALADALAEQLGAPTLREQVLSGWGSLLKPAAFQGYLCFGPNAGQNVTFVQPAAWIGAWSPLDPEESMADIARRYLAAYGPASAEGFARWWGLEAAPAKKLFKRLGESIVEVDVEGWRAFALATTVDDIAKASAAPTVRLLPGFDPYTVAVARQSRYLMNDAYRGRVYRQQGWISAVVLVNGRIEGVWTHDKKRSKTDVTVSLFEPVSEDVKAGIEAEVARLGAFLGTETTLSYADA